MQRTDLWRVVALLLVGVMAATACSSTSEPDTTSSGAEVIDWTVTAPTPTSVEQPPRVTANTILVSPTGDLAAAIAAAPDGTRIQLAAGEYPISRLHVWRRISLRGVGPETVLSASIPNDDEAGEAWGLRISGSRVVLESLKIQATSRLDALVEIDGSATPHFERVQVDGRGLANEGVSARNGLSGDLMGIWIGNAVETGFVVGGRDSVGMVGVTSTGNGLHGFHFVGRARTLAIDAVASANGGVGILLEDDASVRAIRTVAAGNQGAGYVAQGQSSLSGDDVSGVDNAEHGFEVTDDASLDLTSAIADRNGESGFAAFDAAMVTLVDSAARINAGTGFTFNDDVTPTITRAVAKGNGGVGFAWFDQTAGSGTDLCAIGNGQHGYALAHEAAPTILGHAQDNESYGFHWVDEAAGRYTFSAQGNGEGPWHNDQTTSPQIEHFDDRIVPGCGHSAEASP